MKKLLLGSFLVANIMMLTSCLGDGNNENSGYFLGVVEFDMKTFRNIIYFSDYDLPLYASNLATSIQDNECCLIYYTMKGEDNPDPVTTGYYNVVGTGYQVVPSERANSFLTDTSKVQTGEIASESVQFYNYVKGHLFLSSVHEKMGDQQKNMYDLSFDPAQEPEEINGKNVYNLFLRVTKVEDGKSPEVTREAMNAYYIYDYFNNLSSIEKNKGKDRYCFRINYVKSMNDDKIQTWGVSDVYEIGIPTDTSN